MAPGISGSGRTILVVPCYNEAARWRAEYWEQICTSGSIALLFVNDGSTDGTQAQIDATCAATGSSFVAMPVNSGKGEALRYGLQQASGSDVDIIGFLDADAAFTSDDVQRINALAHTLVQGSGFDSDWASRILLGGRDVQRKASRHYIGRLVATLLAPIHKHPVYDTQTGFKLFLRDDRFRACLGTPFVTRWFPDIELMLRWRSAQASPMRVWEEPVMAWHDVDGSNLGGRHTWSIIKEIWRLYRSPERRSSIGTLQGSRGN